MVGILRERRCCTAHMDQIVSKMMKYEVTIGIPVYNVEKYIAQTVESVLAQTFESIEFLFCDDCGTDGSMDIVREYQKNHPRGKDIHTVCQPHNMGLGEARNRMLSVCQGRYVYFMDSDDTIAPDTIQKLYETARKYDAELVYGSMRKILLYENNRQEDMPLPSKVFTKPDEYAEYVYQRYDMMPATTCNFLIKLEVYQKNDLHYQPINFWEDFTFTMDLPTYVTRVVLLPDITYNYYCRTGSLSNYQMRTHIAKSEIQQTIDAVGRIKQHSSRIMDKPYFGKRMYKVMLTDFYVVCSILKHQAITEPAFTTSEIRNVMRSPLSLRKTLCLPQWKFRNLFLYLLGILPPFLSVAIMKQIGRRRGLI